MESNLNSGYGRARNLDGRIRIQKKSSRKNYFPGKGIEKKSGIMRGILTREGTIRILK